jgi:hypothetical protein
MKPRGGASSDAEPTFLFCSSPDSGLPLIRTRPLLAAGS